jgi:hypothetical protein
MKKLLLSILLLGGLNASAQVNFNSKRPIGKIIYTTYHKENYDLVRVNVATEMYGTDLEKTTEANFRKSTVAEYKKLGYAFDGMVTGANGKFMKFVK